MLSELYGLRPPTSEMATLVNHGGLWRPPTQEVTQDFAEEKRWRSECANMATGITLNAIPCLGCHRTAGAADRRVLRRPSAGCAACGLAPPGPLSPRDGSAPLAPTGHALDAKVVQGSPALEQGVGIVTWRENLRVRQEVANDLRVAGGDMPHEISPSELNVEAGREMKAGPRKRFHGEVRLQEIAGHVSAHLRAAHSKLLIIRRANRRFSRPTISYSVSRRTTRAQSLPPQ